MKNYPMAPMAQAVQSQGRYGDDILVHMNPAEVRGLASLSPTGRLSTNPQTGQPEAFLPMLAAGLGSWGATALLPSMAPWLAGAIGSGLATSAVTGDLKRGLAAGIMGAGLGAAFGAAGGAGAESAAGAGTADAALSDSVAETLATDATGMSPAEAFNEEMAANSLGAESYSFSPTPNNLSTGAFSNNPASYPGELNMNSPAAPQLGSESFVHDLQAGYVPSPPPPPSTFQERAMAPFQQGSGLSSELLKPTTVFPVAVGASSLAQMDQDDEIEKMAKKKKRHRNRMLQEAYDNLQRGYGYAQPGIGTGYSSHRNSMSWSTPLPKAYAGGGIVQLAEGGEVQTNDIDVIAGKVNQGVPLTAEEWLIWYASNEGQDAYKNYEDPYVGQRPTTEAPNSEPEPDPLLDEYKAIYDDNPKNLTFEQAQYLLSNGAVIDPRALKEGIRKSLQLTGDLNLSNGKNVGYDNGYGGIDPVEVQANLRGGDYSVVPPPDYMPGFEPEFDYFQDDPNNIKVPSRHRYPFALPRIESKPYFEPAMPYEDYKDAVDDYRDTVDQPDFDIPPYQNPDYTDPGSVTGDRPTTSRPTTPSPTTPRPTTPVAPPRDYEFTYGAAPAGAYSNPDQRTGYWDDNSHVTMFDPTSGKYITTTVDKENIFEFNPKNDVTMWGNADGGHELIYKAENYEDYGDKKYVGDNSWDWTVGYEDPTKGNSAPTQMGMARDGGQSFDSNARRTVAGGSATPTPTADPSTSGVTTDEGLMQLTDRGEKWEANRDTILGKIAAGTADDAMKDWYSRYKASGGIPIDSSITRKTISGGMAAGGTVPLNTGAGQVNVQGGGIANIPTAFTQQPDPQQEMQMVAMAVLGQVENADAIINMFIKKYGVAEFLKLREQVLQSAAPGAQTEGMIRGQGGGMDDQVPGMIGNQQPVATSPGEYIVPADVVSGLGDGSSDAGAAELDGMLQRVRMARGGTTNQPPAINTEGVMPR